MKHSARIQACIEILDSTIKAPIPMDLVIGDYMRGRRYIGSKDRAFIAERVYDIMRRFGLYGWIISDVHAPANGRGYALTHLVMDANQSIDDIADIFDGQKHAPKTLTEKERSTYQFISENRDGLVQRCPDHLRLECPEKYKDELSAFYGESFEEQMKALQSHATLDLRVNIRATHREEVRKGLLADGVETDETPLSPWGLRCRDKIHLSKTRAFRKGQIEIQDEGSQLIAVLCSPQSGQQILDYCAGGGGKTLAIAAAMQGKGRLVATDIDGKRLAKTKTRLKRAGLSDNCEVRPLDEKRLVNWINRQDSNFDTVLVDAPCSGTGTWRRNPDNRWFQYGPDLDELIPMQREILDKAARIPKPDGRLVYATCSILPRENEEQVAWFLEQYPDYKVMPLEKAWPTEYPLPDIFKNETLMRLSPLHHNTDGFFAAVLVRQ